MLLETQWHAMSANGRLLDSWFVLRDCNFPHRTDRSPPCLKKLIFALAEFTVVVASRSNCPGSRLQTALIVVPSIDANQVRSLMAYFPARLVSRDGSAVGIVA